MKIKITSSLVLTIALILFMLHSAYSFWTSTNEKDATSYEIIGYMSFCILTGIVGISSLFLIALILSGKIKLFPDKTININLPQNNKKELDELYRRIGEESVKKNESNVKELFKELDKLKK